VRLEELGREKCVAPDIICQKNKITRRWTKRSARPSAAKDQRAASAYIFGAICPKEGAALVMPRCNTEAMNLRLAENATRAARGAHAALLKNCQPGELCAWPVSVFCVGPWPIGASPACPFRILSRKGTLTAWRHKATNLST
jgi:hypothetical protein